MAIRQTRIFVKANEAQDWAETVMGQVIAPMVDDLEWFWFSRYVQKIASPGERQEDRDDCNFDRIPGAYKEPLNFAGGMAPGHRSLRFRFAVDDTAQATFEASLQALITERGYSISHILDYDYVADLGSNRHSGDEHRGAGCRASRAKLVTQLYQSISKLVLDALVSEANGRFHLEKNDDRGQNPHRSTFETLHHLFCNITAVPTFVLVGPLAVGTHWNPPEKILTEMPISF